MIKIIKIIFSGGIFYPVVFINLVNPVHGLDIRNPLNTFSFSMLFNVLGSLDVMVEASWGCFGRCWIEIE